MSGETIELESYLRKIFTGRTEEETEIIMNELKARIEEVLETGSWSEPSEEVKKILSAANTKDFVNANLS